MAKVYNHILQGSEATEENAINHARGIDWQSVETQESNTRDYNFIESINGVDIYYQYGADYYFFSPSE